MMALLKNLKLNYITDKNILKTFSQNYGGPFHQPLAIVEPVNQQDIINLVVWANCHKIPLAVKGFGHSTGKQQEALQGIMINIRTLNQIRGISFNGEGESIIDVDSGVSWKELIDYTLAHNKIPYVITDWLLLTVGGTLCLGGIGAASFRYGLQADYLSEASIVTKEGELYTASPSQNHKLFDAIRGGLGQFGVVTALKIRLTQSPQSCLVHKIIYTNLNQFIKDSFTLLKKQNLNGIIAHFECNIESTIKKRLGTHYKKLNKNAISQAKWLAILELTQFKFDTLKVKPLTDNLKSDLIFTDEYKIKDYLYRIPPILDSNLEKNSVQHTECTLFFPYNEKTLELISYFLDQLNYEILGYGTILFVPMNNSAIQSPYFIRPASKQFFLFGILSRHLNDQASTQFNKLIDDFYKKSLAIGACRYPCDSLVTTDWPRHFGSKWEEFQALKRTFNPNNIYSPGLSIP